MSETGISSGDNVQQYVDDTYGTANSCMSPDDRAASVMAAVNERLAAEGLPYVQYQWGSGSAAGQFDFRTWTMELGYGPFSVEEADNASTAQQADLLDTVYHEARHSEQWFRMARNRAGLGATAADIVAVMHIPHWVADLAVANPIRECDPSQFEAEQWYQSVYGSGAGHRNDVLNDVDNRYDEYRQLPEESDAWSSGGSVTDEYTSRSQ